MFLVGAVYIGYYAVQAVATQIFHLNFANYTPLPAGGTDVAP